MKRTLLWLIVLMIVVIPSLALANSASERGLVIESGITQNGNIATFARPIVINGVVEGDVTSVVGSIIVRGAVEGDVVSLFGNVTFESSAVADGNVMAAVGTVSTDQSAQVAASGTVFSGNLTTQAASSLIPGVDGEPVTPITRLLTIFVLSILGLIISILFSLIWPRSINSAAQAIHVAFDRAAALGLIWLVISIITMTVIAGILILSLVGLAFLPLALLVAQIPYLAGLAVAGNVIGTKIGLHGTSGQIVGSALILVAPLLIAPLSMTVAFLAFYTLAGIGIGGLILLRVSVAYRHSALA